MRGDSSEPAILLRRTAPGSKRAALSDASAIVVFATIGLLSHDGALSVHGYARDVLPLGIGWFLAFVRFRGRFLPTWLLGTVVGVAVRTVVLGHYHWNVLAFLAVTLVFLGCVAGLMRIVVRRFGV